MPDRDPAGGAEVGGAEGGSTRFGRRQLLRGAAAGIAGAAALSAASAAGAAGAAEAGRRRSRASRPAGYGRTPPAAVSKVTLGSGVVIPVARWVVLENEKPGTIDWVVTGVQVPHAIEGYASQVSAKAGDEVTVFVNTTARSVSLQAFRMGYYQGLGGRLVYQSDSVAGQQQPASSLVSGVNTVSCSWEPTLSFRVDGTWPPGCYLLKIAGDSGEQQYVPLTIRDDESTSAFVIQNSVTTWQAYNLWDGYSLYYGKTASGQNFTNRSRIVSFDRPYPQTWAQGSADFLGNEFPLLYHLESLGADLTYWTDVDLHARPQLLVKHQCLFSLGHDEYWSLSMRNAALSALAKGTNLAFLGANACYRQIRLQQSPVGPDRQQVCYKDATEDPMLGVNDAVVTGPSWESAPTTWPESNLIGSMYQSVRANDDLVITDASSWVFDGCGLSDGQQLPNVVQGEYDRYVPTIPGPRNVDVLGHSPVSGQGNWSDMTYYTVPNGGGVLATGMASFVNKLANTTAFPSNVVPAAIPGVTDVLLRAMENVYGAFGAGPASATQPSSGNWTAIYEGSAASAPSAKPTHAA
ncbi:MAG: N,N-dimethylformamidase beta subunit family domain-containing protein [Acidimicrobiales bacterium]